MTAIDILRSDGDVLALAEEWSALWRSVPEACPFQSPFWLLPWWQAFGTGDARVAVLRRDGALRGILPLYRLENRLLLMGAGTTDYLDALMAPGEDVSPLLDAILRDDNLVCDLSELPPHAALRNVTLAGCRMEEWIGEPCPVLSLDVDLSAVPKGMKRDVRQARNRASRAGGYEIRRATQPDWHDFFAVLVELHGARWRGRAEPGVLADPAVLLHHRTALPGLLAQGLAQLWGVWLNGAPAAMIYALLSARDRIYFYLSGFDDARSFESPGTILLAAMLEDAAAQSRREAHFLRGTEAYKYAWGARDRFNEGRRLRRLSPEAVSAHGLPPS